MYNIRRLGTKVRKPMYQMYSGIKMHIICFDKICDKSILNCKCNRKTYHIIYAYFKLN